MRKAAAIELTEKERGTLLVFSRGKKVTVRLAQRSAIILLAADGHENIAIATRLKITRQRVARWRGRYAALGLPGIVRNARPGPGASRRYRLPASSR